VAEIKWDLLVDRINDGKCTPFLGAGACADVLPVGGAVAQTWGFVDVRLVVAFVEGAADK